MKKYKILVINPGSTSTKIAVYLNDKAIFLNTIQHAVNKLNAFKSINDQYAYRKEAILKSLKDGYVDINKVNAVIGRGGILKPIESGIYEVNDLLVNDLKTEGKKEHASNLGGILAYDIARIIPGVKAYIADPVVVDEMTEEAQVAGHPEFKRISLFHALNHKAVARRYAKSIKKDYKDLNLIVAHLGGGISIGAHYKGKVIDVNQALDGEGPFSPERSGTLPAGDLVDYCFSGRKDKDTIKKMITGQGGLTAYLGTNNTYEVEMMINSGNEYAKFILKALAYQVAKEIGSMAVVLNGKVDCIIITGGLAYNKMIIDWIKNKASFISDIVVYPGEDEMNALAMNAYQVLKGEIHPKQYF